MEKITWDNEFYLGVEKIDEQHKKLFDLIGDFYDALTIDENLFYEKRSEILKGLVEYTEYHFKTEEDLFDKHDYSSADLHKSQHRTFISEVSRQLENVLVADISHAKVFYGFLVTWLLSHIARADRAFCAKILDLSNSNTEPETE